MIKDMGLLSLYHQVEQENRRIIRDMVEEDIHAKLLDCGCGRGEFTRELSEKIRTNDVYGIEFVNEVAQLAEENGIKIYRANLNERLPIEDEMFDSVHANQVIEHLYGTDVFIKEMYRILKMGGYAIVSTPNLASFHNIISLIFGKQPFTSHISNEVIMGNSFDPKRGMIHGTEGEIHLRIFAYEALKELFEYHGFEVEKIVGVGYYPFPNAVGRFLSWIDKKHAVYLTMKVRKR